MKKILVVSFFFPPISGGASLRMWRFCIALSNDLDIKVLTVIHPTLSYPVDSSLMTRIKEIEVNRAKIFKFDKLWTYIPWLKLLFPIGYFGKIIPLTRKGKKILKKTKFDYIMGVYPTIISMLSSYNLSKATKIPLIIDLHDLFYDSIKHNLHTSLQKIRYLNLERKIFTHASVISVVTEEFKTILIKRYRIKQNKIVVIPNSVDLSEFRSIKIEKRKEIIISYFGNIADYHLEGILLLIKALNIIKKEQKHYNLKFQLFSPLTPYIRKKILELDREKTTEIMGYVNKSRANYSMMNSDILYLTLSPTHKYALEMKSTNPSKLFEYIACGKPILAYLPEGSSQKLIEENKLGFVITEDRVEILANLIKELFNDENLREMFSKNSLKLASRFDSKVVYKQFLQMLE